MKKISFKKIILLILILSFSVYMKTEAASITLETPKKQVGIGEQFYVDLILDPDNQSINTISGNISFSSGLVSFIRAEEAKSMVHLWIDHPTIIDNRISFSGIMPNGFDGVIDPFNQSHKLPGLIIRLVFEASKPGDADIITTTFVLNLNDGQGTEILVSPVHNSINIGNFVNNFKYENNTKKAPELEAYITRDPNIYNNKYILIFLANDKTTGIKNVMIKEGKRDWKEIESPYLLEDQSRHSLITLQATNFSGLSTVRNIDKIPYRWGILVPILVVIIVVISIFIIKKKYVHKK
ncbi:MAG: cohesin domain-containing protein [Candidatus Paceibacterota bacterium]|jgi:hypothetical protein